MAAPQPSVIPPGGRTEENGIQPGGLDRLHRTVRNDRFGRYCCCKRTGVARCSLIYVCFCSISWKVDLRQATWNSRSGPESDVALTLSNDSLGSFNPVRVFDDCHEANPWGHIEPARYRDRWQVIGIDGH